MITSLDRAVAHYVIIELIIPHVKIFDSGWSMAMD